MAAIDENPVKQSLLKAIRKGQASKVTEILKQNPKFTADETLDAAQNRLLHKAARYGKVNVVQTLLTLGADVNGENKFHMTAMHHAAVEGSAEVIAALIEAGAKVNHPDNAKRLPLHWTCAYGHLEATKVLLGKGQAKVNVPDKEGFYPLHRCCQEAPPSSSQKNDQESEEDTSEAKEAKNMEDDVNRSEIAKLLVAKGVDVNVKEPQGLQTPLHLSAINGYVSLVRTLLDFKADVNVVNKISKTPLIYAASENHLKCLEVLAKAEGIDINKIDVIHNDWNALHYAILQDNVNAVKILIQAGADYHQTDGIGRNPQIIADDHFKNQVSTYLKSLK